MLSAHSHHSSRRRGGGSVRTFGASMYASTTVPTMMATIKQTRSIHNLSVESARADHASQRGLFPAARPLGANVERLQVLF
jgi:hypothetical protein